MRRRRVVVIAAVALGAPLALGPDAEASSVTLPSRCFDQRVEPSSVVLTCADGGFVALELVWSDWGEARARATGIASVNLCRPSCAEGKRRRFPVELVAKRKRDCAYGRPQYTRVTYTFPESSPFPRDAPGSRNPTIPFACPRRPHPDPRIESMQMRLTGHGRPGPGYRVRVDVRLRICAVRGPAEVVFRERFRLGGRTFAARGRTVRYRQRRACETRTFGWRLGDEFFGVGTYVVTATASDKDFQASRPVSRRHTTTD